MTPPADIVQAAREHGFVGRASGSGYADLGLVEAAGPDARTFLQAQTTNDVDALKPGDGQASARVSRTGHVISSFSLHRLPDDGDAQRFLLALEPEAVERLVEAFESFLFADEVTFTDRTESWNWVLVQGPRAADVLDAAVGPVGFEPWSTWPLQSVREVRRLRGGVEGGLLGIRRSVCGDDGFFVGWPADRDPEPLLARIRSAGEDAGMGWLTADQTEAVVEVLRMEAGRVRLGVDFPDRKTLLPELGIEQHAVSYTKGCYIGQEVIARVRTYGSVPYALRAILLDEPVEQAPGTGLTVDGKKVGVLGPVAESPVVGGPIALVTLNRSSRTPGQVLDADADGVSVKGTVALLPLYSAADTEGRVQFLYDQGIKRFAAGRPAEALELLEQALRLDSGFADGYEAIGVMLGRSGRYHEAIDFFRRLEEVAPEEPLVNTNLSLYYMKLGDKVTAEEEAAKVVQKQFRKNMADSGKTAAEIVEEEEKAKRADAERKKSMFGQVLEIDDEDPIALFGLGNALFTLGELDEAVAHFERAQAAQKNNSAVYLAHGKALEALDRVDDALSVYQAGMEIASKRGDLMPLKEMQHRTLLLQGAATGTPG